MCDPCIAQYMITFSESVWFCHSRGVVVLQATPLTCKRGVAEVVQHEMSLRTLTKAVLLACLLLVCAGAAALLKYTSLLSAVRAERCQCECPSLKPPPSSLKLTPNAHLIHTSNGERRYLSYQPPGNGWNNQRIALENALVLAKLLNRTLVVHPLAPHALGSQLKASHHNAGYIAYNMLNESDLLPLSKFMDLRLMSEVVPVVEVNTSHRHFLQEYSGLKWKNVCHSTGYGYWVDEVPQTAEELEMLSNQKFTPIRIWRDKCEDEKVRSLRDPSPIVRFVSDLASQPAEMLYFEQGTLFAIHICFTTIERALDAQSWVVDHVQYSSEIWTRVEQVAAVMGGQLFNAIQVRRKMHLASKLPQSFWLDRMVELNFSKNVPVYVATNDVDLEWFQAFKDAGYKLYFSTDFSVLNFTGQIASSLESDYLAIHEQCICEKALKFIPSPASTFVALILRNRREVKYKDGLMMDTLHTFWIGHQLKNT